MVVRPWTACDAVPGESAMAETGLRTNHQSRVDWWRGQFGQQKANLSVTELCRTARCQRHHVLLLEETLSTRKFAEIAGTEVAAGCTRRVA